MILFYLRVRCTDKNFFLTFYGLHPINKCHVSFFNFVHFMKALSRTFSFLRVIRMPLLLGSFATFPKTILRLIFLSGTSSQHPFTASTRTAEATKSWCFFLLSFSSGPNVFICLIILKGLQLFVFIIFRRLRFWWTCNCAPCKDNGFDFLIFTQCRNFFSGLYEFKLHIFFYFNSIWNTINVYRNDIVTNNRLERVGIKLKIK